MEEKKMPKDSDRHCMNYRSGCIQRGTVRFPLEAKDSHARGAAEKP